MRNTFLIMILLTMGLSVQGCAAVTPGGYGDGIQGE